MGDYWDQDYDSDFDYDDYEYDDDADYHAEVEFDDGREDAPEVEFAGEPEWEEGEFEFDYDYSGEVSIRPETGLNPFLLVALALILFFGFIMLIPLGQRTETIARPVLLSPTPVPTSASSMGGLPGNAFVAPYDDYWVTQGEHGSSYGHNAVDIAAGKGTTIRSPIAGRVTDKRVDGVGNTVLVIENDYYSVMLMHGVYTVEVGDEVSWGDKVGEESNIGYTLDMSGRLCTGRDCGYHTHLNVFDKQIGQNVNPLTLLSDAAEEPLVVGSRVQRSFETP